MFDFQKKNKKVTKMERKKEKKKTNLDKHVVFHACRATSMFLFAACSS